MTELIYLSKFNETIGRKAPTARVIRGATGGNFRLYRIRAEAGRAATVLISVHEAAEWCRRVIRPWSSEQEAALFAAARPHSAFILEAERG